jgi:hypothetical protein
MVPSHQLVHEEVPAPVGSRRSPHSNSGSSLIVAVGSGSGWLCFRQPSDDEGAHTSTSASMSLHPVIRRSDRWAPIVPVLTQRRTIFRSRQRFTSVEPWRTVEIIDSGSVRA